MSDRTVRRIYDPYNMATVQQLMATDYAKQKAFAQEMIDLMSGENIFL